MLTVVFLNLMKGEFIRIKEKLEKQEMDHGEGEKMAWNCIELSFW